MNKTLYVRDVVRRNILECSPVETLRTVARRMDERRCSSILVVDGGQAVGIWTERDALELDLDTSNCSQKQIADYMSSPVMTISGHLSLEEAALRFNEKRVRHYLVLGENNERLGMISQTDIVLNQDVNAFLFLKKASSIVNASPCVASDAPLSDATHMMRQGTNDAIAVLFPSEIPGILSERDVVKALAPGKAISSVGEIASSSMMTIDENETVYSARNTMVDNGFRHIGVTGSTGQLIGIINFSDIMKSMLDGYCQYLKNELTERTGRLRQTEEYLALANQIIKTSPDGVMVTDHDSIIQSINPAFMRITGYSPEEVIGQTPAILQSGRHDQLFYQEMWTQLNEVGRWQGEIWNRRKNGETYPEILTISRIDYMEGKSLHYVAIFSDISTLKKREEEAKRLALYDPLTGLPNRRLLEDRIKHRLSEGKRYNEKCGALFFIDIDHFKPINDSFGHDVGDRLLLEVADRLMMILRKEDTAARLGGDEFVILLSDLGNQMQGAIAQAEIIAEKVRRAIEATFLIKGHELKVTSSSGIKIFQGIENDFELLIKQADIAMYRAKEKGRNQFYFYDVCTNS